MVATGAPRQVRTWPTDLAGGEPLGASRAWAHITIGEKSHRVVVSATGEALVTAGRVTSHPPKRRKAGRDP